MAWLTWRQENQHPTGPRRPELGRSPWPVFHLMRACRHACVHSEDTYCCYYSSIVITTFLISLFRFMSFYVQNIHNCYHNTRRMSQCYSINLSELYIPSHRPSSHGPYRSRSRPPSSRTCWPRSAFRRGRTSPRSARSRGPTDDDDDDRTDDAGEQRSTTTPEKQ